MLEMHSSFIVILYLYYIRDMNIANMRLGIFNSPLLFLLNVHKSSFYYPNIQIYLKFLKSFQFSLSDCDLSIYPPPISNSNKVQMIKEITYNI